MQSLIDLTHQTARALHEDRLARSRQLFALGDGGAGARRLGLARRRCPLSLLAHWIKSRRHAAVMT